MARDKKAAQAEKEVAVKEKAVRDEKKAANIPQLLKELAATDDPSEKRKIRARLRAAGHTGGLGGKRGPGKGKKAKVKAAEADDGDDSEEEEESDDDE